jgi:hypothetical protein
MMLSVVKDDERIVGGGVGETHAWLRAQYRLSMAAGFTP